MQYGAWGNLNRTIELSKYMEENDADAIQADTAIENISITLTIYQTCLTQGQYSM